MGNKARYSLVLLVLGGMLVMIGCNTGSPYDPSELTPVIVQLRWTHQAQFAGFYAADQNGYYAEEGLAVTFIEGGPGVEPLETVLDGTADFGVADSSVLILGRAEGKPVRAIAAIYRRSPVVFFSLAESGITSPEDFIGKTIGLGRQGLPVLQTMMAHVGVTSNQYTVSIGNDLSMLSSGEIDVIGGYLINEALQAKEAGYDLNLIHPDDYGVHTYADCLFSTDDLLSQNPETTKRFLRATIRGWSYVVDHPETAGDLVLTYDPQADVEHQRWMMIFSIPLIYTGEDSIGQMQDGIWREMAETLHAQGVLTRELEVDQIYTTTFLDQVSGDP